MNTYKNLPTFICVGAARSGTTAFYQFLNNHKEVFIASPKELNYFATINKKHFDDAPQNIKEYVGFFVKADKFNVRGEISPLYFCLPESAENINELLPNVKLIFILRNPVKRMISDYYYGLHNNYHKFENIEDYINTGYDLLRKNRTLIRDGQPSFVLFKGFYSIQFSPYFNLFPRSQIKIFLFDDLLNSPNEVKAELCEFLGISNLPDINFEKINTAAYDESQVTREVKELLLEIYQRDIRRCAQLINRNLEKWLTLGE